MNVLTNQSLFRIAIWRKIQKWHLIFASSLHFLWNLIFNSMVGMSNLADDDELAVVIFCQNFLFWTDKPKNRLTKCTWSRWELNEKIIKCCTPSTTKFGRRTKQPTSANTCTTWLVRLDGRHCFCCGFVILEASVLCYMLYTVITKKDWALCSKLIFNLKYNHMYSNHMCSRQFQNVI